MSITWDTLPVLAGAQIETVRLDPSGIHIPTTIVRGVTGDGNIASLLVDGDGKLRSQAEGRAFESALTDGERLAVDDMTGELLPERDRAFLSIDNSEGPGDVFLLFGDGAAAVGGGKWIPFGGGWEMPSGARWVGAIQAIATAPSFVAVAEY